MELEIYLLRKMCVIRDKRKVLTRQKFKRTESKTWNFI